MRKFLLLMVIVLFVGMLLLLSQPQMRHILFTGVTQFPEFATMQAMKGGLVTRDFNRVLPWLHRQFEIADLYGKEKNKMTPGLLQNIKKAYKVAVLQEEREKFIPLLEKAYELNPENIDLNIMLASAYQFLEPQKSIIYLEKAQSILPSDPRIFQLVNIILRNSEDIEAKRLWCEAYRTEQFGDYEEYKSSTLLGTGYRRMALEYESKNTRNLLLNEGIQLGERIKYEFILGNSSQLLFPSLRLANGGGLEVVFHGIELYSQGRLIKVYTRKLIELYPESGFIVDDKVISLNTQGENIFINLEDINEYDTDKVLIELTINKLPLDNTGFCEF